MGLDVFHNSWWDPRSYQGKTILKVELKLTESNALVKFRISVFAIA